MRRSRLLHLLVACATTAVMLAAASAAQATPIFGFNDSWHPDTIASTIARSRMLGANSERIQVYWGSFEPRPGVYQWGGLDTGYYMMLANGIRPLLDVVSAPSWATQPGCNDIYRCQQSPSHDGAFAEFVRELTARYPQAIGVEIGNEPNLTNWVMHPNPDRYAQMLKVGYAAVKRANPGMPVITGATCCTTIHSNGNIPATDFLNRLYADGIKGHYDYLGFHLYPGGPVSRVAPDLKLEMSRMRGVRDAHGDNSQFWITETGFPSAGVSAYGGGVFNEDNQAQREAIDYRVVSQIPDVAALYFYRLTDPTEGLGASMGFYHADLSPKPAVQALLDAEQGPPWPTYAISATAPKVVRAGRPFQLRVSGQPPAGSQYGWAIWRLNQWIPWGGATANGSSRRTIWHPGTYLLQAQVTTDLDVYMSNPVQIRVVTNLHSAGTGGKSAHHKAHKKKRKRHKKHKHHKKNGVLAAFF